MRRKLRDKISAILVKWSMPTRQIAISEILALFDSQKLDILDRYTTFLLEHGYVDSDVWAEEPTSINMFLEEERDENCDRTAH